MKVGALAGVLLFSSQARADHWTSPDDVVLAAHELEEEAVHFANAVLWETGYSHLQHDAEHLAEAAADLHDVVESGWGYYFVKSYFKKVQKHFHHLEHQWEKAHGIHHVHHLEDDWDDVEFAFENLHYAMTAGD
jgi:hypothetical protein